MKRCNETAMVPNKYGIMINKCCASCANRDFDDQERRYCKLTGKHVRGCSVCDDWSMCEGLTTLGCKRGKVQCREYQLHLMEVRTSELNAKSMGQEMTPVSVGSIRKDFELRHGDRFLIH